MVDSNVDDEDGPDGGDDSGHQDQEGQTEAERVEDQEAGTSLGGRHQTHHGHQEGEKATTWRFSTGKKQSKVMLKSSKEQRHKNAL